MPSQTTDSQRHDHIFLGAEHLRNERSVRIVIALTAIMMVGEIVAGLIFGSMALLADGFHMATHAGALAISALAYFYARRLSRDRRFAFGTGKIGELAGFSSALILGGVAILIGIESVSRLNTPVEIRFNEAIAVGVLGLLVNIVSAWLLHGGRHEPGHHHSGGHEHSHQDHNLQSAYFHVLADALTSVLAIAGLFAAKALGWIRIDPIIGIVGAIVIGRWAFGLMRSSGAVLLDAVPDQALAARVRERLETGGDRVTDLHLWDVGPGHKALIVSVASPHPQSPEAYKRSLAAIGEFSHVTVEVCPDGGAKDAA
ncbi:MAG: CDF family Co(II)/Ni(II) efflux transporter DmeF [Parvularculaceae bacterium]